MTQREDIARYIELVAAIETAEAQVKFHAESRDALLKERAQIGRRLQTTSPSGRATYYRTRTPGQVLRVHAESVKLITTEEPKELR